MTSLAKGIILENTYEIIEEIGSGGGGVVFKARHLRLRTDVVVKKIKNEVLGKIKSRQEADILKKLKHPYLPRVYDFLETEDGVYTVMDFIRGENLDDAVKRHGKFSQKEVKTWAEQLGEALNYLHSQKPPIIHSDIKPANIMLTEEGNICLIDFNISLAMGSTMESAVGISAGFSPPEQYRDPALYAKITHNYTLQKSIQASMEDMKSDDERTELLVQELKNNKTELQPYERPKKEAAVSLQDTLPQYVPLFGRGIDTRSDIYSLGITLYFLLVGVKPPLDFDKKIPINETNKFISEGFTIILEKMMELDPSKRYQNGGEFLKAIRNCHKLDHRYVVMHRRQMWIQSVALVSLTLGIMFIFGGVYKMRAEKNSAYYNLVSQAQEAMNIYDFAEAEELLNEAKEISKVRVEAYEEEIHLLYLSGNYEECISHGKIYINTTPFLLESETDKELFGNIYYIVGNACFETEDYFNAKLLFEYAMEYNKQNGLYYRDYAITLAKLGQIEEAEKQLEKGIELGIAQDAIYVALGEIAHVKGQYDAAIEYLNQAIETTDDMKMKKRAILLCVDVYKTVGNDAVDQEIDLLEQYISQFEGNGNLVMSEYLAEAYAQKAQTDKIMAEEYYQKSLELFLTIYNNGYVTYQLQQNMAILYEYLGDFEEAEVLLFQMADSYPERYEVYKRLAFLEADKQQMRENADRDYKQMQIYYEKAKEKYSGEEQDLEMDMLDNMMQELVVGGWI